MSAVAESPQKRPRLPEWFRLKLPTASAYFAGVYVVLPLHTYIATRTPTSCLKLFVNEFCARISFP